MVIVQQAPQRRRLPVAVYQHALGGNRGVVLLPPLSQVLFELLEPWLRLQDPILRVLRRSTGRITGEKTSLPRCD
jgi:hypothetical protein